MTHTSNRGTFLLATGFLFLVGLAALMLLGGALGGGTITVARQQQAAAAAPEWLEGQRAVISPGLRIASHAEKHGTEAWNIYAMLLSGKCADSMTFCGGSEIEKMHVCIDPVTGITGAILQFGDEIMTGYFTPTDPGYWQRRVARENWEVCND